jgi:hypothetical protein
MPDLGGLIVLSSEPPIDPICRLCGSPATHEISWQPVRKHLDRFMVPKCETMTISFLVCRWHFVRPGTKIRLARVALADFAEDLETARTKGEDN